MLIDGPILLLLISIAGYLIAALALRPVDRMRRRADQLSATDLAARLPVTPARDEIGALGRTLNRMLNRLEAAFAHEREFVADASHELRTPLTVLRAELGLALSGRRSADELEAAIRSAIEESDRLIALSDSLLELARSDRGLELETVPVEIAVAVGAVAERLLPAARSNGVEIEITAAGPAVVEADPLGLDQALFNLLDNAIRCADQRVEVVVTDSVQRMEILVRDDGPGFPRSCEGVRSTASSGLTAIAAEPASDSQ